MLAPDPLEPVRDIQRIALHYVDDAIWIDLNLPLDYASDDTSLQTAFNRAINGLSTVTGVRLYYVQCSESGKVHNV